MATWQVQDAKARFSEFLQACFTSYPQWVTKREQDAAVLVPVPPWRPLDTNRQPSLKHLLLELSTERELLIVPRGQVKRRLYETF
jgi:prevent-host-death family protein